MHRKTVLAPAIVSVLVALAFQSSAALAAQAETKPADHAMQSHAHEQHDMAHMQGHTDEKMSPQKQASGQPAADAPKAKRKKPAEDKSKHFHPRDGKN